jgi:hypothetical protein
MVAIPKNTGNAGIEENNANGVDLPLTDVEASPIVSRD